MAAMPVEISYLFSYFIEEKYRVFDNFGRPGAVYDDSVWILNRF